MKGRIIGAVLLFLGGTLAGEAAAERLRRRERLLTDLHFALGMMQSEIELLKTPTPALLDRLSRFGGAECREFFAEAAREMTGQPLMAAWQSAAGRLKLADAAVDAVARLGAVLGRFDPASQARELELCRRSLEDIIQIERKNGAGRQRAYVGAGACLGLTAAVILF